MRLYYRLSHSEDSQKSIESAPDFNDEEAYRVMASFTELAPISDMHYTYLLVCPMGVNTLATEVTAEEARNACYIMSLLLHHFKGLITIHIVPTKESAVGQAGHMNRNLENTAIAVFKTRNDKDIDATLLHLESSDAISSIFVTPDALTSSIGIKLMTILLNSDRLGRFVYYEANLFDSGRFEYEEDVNDFVQSYSTVPLMSWATSINEDDLDTVLGSVGVDRQQTVRFHLNFYNDQLTPLAYQNCDKFLNEQRVQESRNMTIWALDIVDTFNERRAQAMSANIMIPLLLGYPTVYENFGNRRDYGAMYGFESTTIHKLFQELEVLGIIKGTGNRRAKAEKLLMYNSEATRALRDGRIRVHLPIRRKYIYPMVFNPGVNPDILTLRVPFHDKAECSCNNNHETKEVEGEA